MPAAPAAAGAARRASPAEWLRRLEDGELAIGIIGLGYVGLPLAQAACATGLRVTGFDIDPAKVEFLNAGRSYIRQIPDAAVAAMRAEAGFAATDDFDRLDAMDAILICVPTPLGRHREPDLSFVTRTAETIAARLRPGQLVVLESTTFPGTTREVVKPILEGGGLRSGEHFHLAYSPEREDPGNAEFGTSAIPRVIGGDGPDALALACALYGRIVVRTVPVASPEVAEAVKLTENIFRSVNIALANELKGVYAAMGIDVWDVIEAARTKPFGFMPFYPGPGLGGHCIPIDPFYLAWKAREFEVPTRFVELAGEINAAMPRRVVEALAAALDAQGGRGLAGAQVLVVGLAYKPNVDDTRESPSLRLIELIEARGGITAYHDPLIPVIPLTREHAALAGRRSVLIDPATLAGYDAVLIATDHASVDHAAIAGAARLVVDTRNACARAGATGPTIVKA